MAARGSLTLAEDTQAWEARVKDARQAKHPAATIDLAVAAADAIERHISTHPSPEDEKKAAMIAVKRFTFNAAADAWPGWEVDGPRLDNAILVRAREAAVRSTDLVIKLQLGQIQQGTGVWLIGALDLALGKLDEALIKFCESSALFSSASAPGLALLTDGYTVIAAGLSQKHNFETIMARLEEINSRISAGSFEDGPQWIEQLHTALVVFSQ